MMPNPGNVRRRAALCLLVAVLAAGAAFATSYLELTPAQMLTKADLVFVGTVRSLATVEKDGAPWTRVTFAVSDGLVGTSGDSVTLDFLGGEIAGGETLSVSGMPTFQRGERVLLMAYDQPYASPVVGFRQGVWRVGDAGLVDLDGRPLALDGGALVRGDTAAGLDEVVAAIRELRPQEGTP